MLIKSQSEVRLHTGRSVHFHPGRCARPSFSIFRGSGSETISHARAHNRTTLATPTSYLGDREPLTPAPALSPPRSFRRLCQPPKLPMHNQRSPASKVFNAQPQVPASQRILRQSPAPNAQSGSLQHASQFSKSTCTITHF